MERLEDGCTFVLVLPQQALFACTYCCTVHLYRRNVNVFRYARKVITVDKYYGYH